MATDMFIKIDDVKGDATDEKHKGEIEVLAWNWGVTQTGTMHSGPGGGAGKANVQDVTITKWVDRATPKLLQYALMGKHIGEALLTVRKAGGKPLEYLKLKLSGAIITSQHLGGSGGEERQTETLSINFAKVQLDYVPQKGDGTGDAAIPVTWDISKNSAS